jgi:ParB/RepB/Spo0J family partition protein
MSSIENVSMGKIKPNPFRMLEKYPYDEDKLETLQSSIEETGFWEGVIARKHSDEFQLAFGHHRVEAARRNGLKEIPLVIHDLTDEKMLKMMARENMEDYRTSFLILLETWEAAANYLSHLSATNAKAIDIAKFLGWARKRAENLDERTQLNNTAKATSGALKLINAGHLTRADFEGLGTTAVMHLVQKGSALLRETDQFAKENPVAIELLELKRERVIEAVKATAEESRAGGVATDKIPSTVEAHRYSLLQESKRESPDFDAFATRLSNAINKLLIDDVPALHLKETKTAMSGLYHHEDLLALKRIDFALALLIERADEWRNQLTFTPKAITNQLAEQPLQLTSIGA